MDFTKGKLRQYEHLMKERPGFARSRPSEEEEAQLRKQAQEVESGRKKRNHKRRRED